jgi:predicted PurR-regulated permease PerM
MSSRSAAATSRKAPPMVRLPPKSNFEVLLARGSQVAVIVIAIVVAVAALSAGSYILVPISAGIVIGLMLGPVASRLEAHDMRPSVSALIVTVLFLVILLACALAIAAPLALWIERLPQIWTDLKGQLRELSGPLEAVRGMRDQLRELTGGKGIAVSVDDGMGVESMMAFAPAVTGQFLMFFASLYFFVATRNQTRVAILSMCFSRRLRWRVAHVFRDVEALVSKYLISITLINIAEGATVGLALWLIGVPSAAMWGAVATVTNFVVFVGPAVMVAILFAVGLMAFDTLWGSLLPVGVYLFINMLEAQFVTPMVIGKTMTLNPFAVLLSLIFWIWLWGPVGGFVAVPALLIAYAVARNIIPGTGWWSDGAENDPARRTS